MKTEWYSSLLCIVQPTCKCTTNPPKNIDPNDGQGFLIKVGNLTEKEEIIIFSQTMDLSLAKLLWVG